MRDRVYVKGVLKEAFVFMHQLLTIASEWFHLTDHVGVSSPVNSSGKFENFESVIIDTNVKITF